MALDCLAGNGRSGVVLGLSHALMEPSIVGAGIGRFILAIHFFESAPIGFVGLVHQTLRQNAVRERCNNYSGLLYRSVSMQYVPSDFAATARGHPSRSQTFAAESSATST